MKRRNTINYLGTRLFIKKWRLMREVDQHTLKSNARTWYMAGIREGAKQQRIKTAEMSEEILTREQMIKRNLDIASIRRDLKNKITELNKLQEPIVAHECEDFSKQVDSDICKRCGEHTGFCVDCGVSECCGDIEYSME